MPGHGTEDQFEDMYNGKFRSLVAGYGVIIKYEKDRGIDFGLHVTKSSEGTRSSSLTDTKVWFQLKGIHETTLSAQDLTTTDSIPLGVSLRHLKFWYAQPEAIYIVVYLEATDEFLLEDVRSIVDRAWGDKFFSAATFRENQQGVTIHIDRAALMSNDRLSHLFEHRSMRIDGPQWRGRPLGHRLDPLRSAMKPMIPEDYRRLVTRLLEVHGYQELEALDPNVLLGGNRPATDRASLSRGIMHSTYEWTHSLFTEFGVGPDSTFRIESAPFHVQGPCAVLSHEQVDSQPDPDAFSSIAEDLRQQHGIEWLLAFVNQPHSASSFGRYSVSVRPLRCVPQDLSGLPFNVLTATLVYLEFRESIEWEYVNYR
jgi:hypothetical protein